MTDRRIDLRSADIGGLNPPSTRRMLDVRDKREPGLVLRLTSKKGGAKRSWTWRYRDGGGKQRRIVFGHWPAMTYAEAVKSLQEARETQSAGEDPIDAKRSTARALSGRLSVAALVERYALVRAPSLKSGAAVVRTLRKNVAPAIGPLAVADVTGDHIRQLLTSERERMAREAAALQKSRQESGGRPPQPRTFITLNRIYAACGSLFTFAINEFDHHGVTRAEAQKGRRDPAEREPERARVHRRGDRRVLEQARQDGHGRANPQRPQAGAADRNAPG